MTEAIEAIAPHGRRLRLDFTWLSDRYSHRISHIDASGAIHPLLESIEGSAHDNWPSSPPLQSLTIEKLADGRPVALLLGMAGGSHWSASVEAATDAAAFIFDIACRHGTNPGQLGSRYLRLSPLVIFRQLALECRDANISDANGTVEITPLFPMLEGTTRWRFTVISP